jgi:diguanylate cyclase (GGDEF)-like protein
MLVALLMLVAVNRREPLAPWLGGVFAALLLWTVAYVFELASASVAGKIAWANPQFIGATLMALLWFYAMRRMAGARRLPHLVNAALWLACLACIVSAFTNPGHLFRGEPTLDHSGPIPFLDADYGPLYFGLWMPFSYGLLVAALATLVRASLHGSQLARARCRLLVVATLLPMCVGILFITGALPWPNFNPAISSLSVSAILCALAMLRYRLLDLTPLARETVIEQLADPLIVADARGLLCDFNPAASRILPELTREEFGRPLSAVLAGRRDLVEALREGEAGPDGLERADPADDEAGVRQRTVSLELSTGPTGSPETHHFTLRVTPVVRRTGLRIGEAIMLHDVTQRVRLYEEARLLAGTDELTGLLSRRRLLELGLREVALARRRGRGLCVMLLDVDHFKLINDRHGHAAGDAVLRALGERCRGELREVDLVGRYGGDEFCVVLPELDADAARHIAERLRAAVAGLAVPCGDGFVHPTVSIGVAGVRADEEATLDGLMRAADEALYEAKNGGRDRVAGAGLGHAECDQDLLLSALERGQAG